tara:strand:+ start:1557 stop:2156 length:600 start_codon:yes stop_codon:yes gene_type:complete
MIGHTYSTSTGDPPVITRIRDLGYAIFDKKPYDINLIAERTPNGQPNRFDDIIHVLYKKTELGAWHHYKFTCTMNPGLYWMHHPSRVAGTAIIKHNQQIRSAFTFGRHKGQYDCLVPTKPIPVWRDNNRDDHADHLGSYTSSSIQIHRASAWRQSTLVNKWSAGCIVLADPGSFSLFMDLCSEQTKQGLGDKFSLCVIG